MSASGLGRDRMPDACRWVYLTLLAGMRQCGPPAVRSLGDRTHGCATRKTNAHTALRPKPSDFRGSSNRADLRSIARACFRPPRDWKFPRFVPIARGCFQSRVPFRFRRSSVVLALDSPDTRAAPGPPKAAIPAPGSHFESFLSFALAAHHQNQEAP